jgi:hypothetical protein
MNERMLTERQAYLAMFSFLAAYYERGPSAIAGLLSSLSLLVDGTSAGAAQMFDWENAVTRVLSGEIDARLRFQDDH